MDEWFPLVDGGQPVFRPALDNVLSLDEENRIDQHDELIGVLLGRGRKGSVKVIDLCCLDNLNFHILSDLAVDR